MLAWICLAIALLTSIAGSICGIGGGVIIKPVLDMTGLIGATQTSLLSGATVLAMSLISLTKRCVLGRERPDMKHAVPLAVGAVAGGYLGKALFSHLCNLMGEPAAGILQASMLMVLTLMTLIYTLLNGRIAQRSAAHPIACIAIGLALGTLSSLLGIGGGPFNLVVLSYFIGMDERNAALNSLFIIGFSQMASMGLSVAVGDHARIDPLLLAGMILGGMAGGWLGSALAVRLSERTERRIFIALLILIMLICTYTVLRQF